MREDVEEGNLQRDTAKKQRRNPEKRETNRGRVPERGGMKMTDMQKEEKRGHGIGEGTARGEMRGIKRNGTSLKEGKGTVMIPEREETEEVIERKEMRGIEKSEISTVMILKKEETGSRMQWKSTKKQMRREDTETMRKKGMQRKKTKTRKEGDTTGLKVRGGNMMKAEKVT